MKNSFYSLAIAALLLGVWAMPVSGAFAQVNTVYGTVNGTIVSPDSLPQYPGGEKAMFQFIGRNMRYPASAIEDGVQGKVFVSYILDEEGNLTEAKVETGVRKDLDHEALRVVNLLKGWKPAFANGKPVKYRHILPLTFRLQ